MKSVLSSSIRIVLDKCIFIEKQEWKQPSRGVPKKRCSENMKQIYRGTPMPRCDFNKVAFNTVAASEKLNYLFLHVRKLRSITS